MARELAEKSDALQKLMDEYEVWDWDLHHGMTAVYHQSRNVNRALTTVLKCLETAANGGPSVIDQNLADFTKCTRNF